jgi:glycosyltransferase involved in cell wall biosynthesis
VTVVVTVYTRTEFLRDALASVLSQSFGDYEVIIADDSGTGAARSIAAPFTDGTRVRYRENPRRLGTALSLRAALDESRGRYVSILNDDDRWEPDFLARLVPPLEADARRVLAFSDHWIMGEDGVIDSVASDRNTARYGRATLAAGDLVDPARFVLLRNGVPLAMASVFRKAALDTSRLVPDVAGAYDFWIACLLAASGQAFYYVPRRLTRYRVHPKMETAKRSPYKAESLVFVFRTLLETNRFPALRRHIRGRLGGAMCRVGRDYLYFNRAAESRRAFCRAFGTSPDWRPLAGWLASFVPAGLRRMIRASGDGVE